MKIEKIAKNNINELTKLMLTLWPKCNFEEELDNCKRILSTEKETCFLMKNQEKYIAFVQLSIRSEYVDGATTSPILYIEGLYVQPEFRRSGIGKKLITAGEAWGNERGCLQCASDTELHNQNSIRFHKKIGFKEVNRVVTFIKKIT